MQAHAPAMEFFDQQKDAHKAAKPGLGVTYDEKETFGCQPSKSVAAASELSSPACPLPGVRDTALPRVTVTRYPLDIPGGGVLFVGIEAGPEEDAQERPCTPPRACVNGDPTRRPGSDITTASSQDSASGASWDETETAEDGAGSARCPSSEGADSGRAFGGTPPFPGNGGTRVLFYKSEADAALECAALAAGMGYKHRCFNTGFSGAKLVAAVPDPATVDKAALIRALALVLEAHEGRLYTGCDLNTSLDDMSALYAATPYVLAGLGATCDPNEATGYGVAGAVAAMADSVCGGLAGCTVFVQGCGKVGTTAARLLLAAGATVLASDIIPGRVAIAAPGAQDVSHLAWPDVVADIFVPCAASGVIDEEAAKAMRQRAVCGSANVPFTTEAALRAAAARGVLFVPEAVSSAGAVIADSIEFFDPDAFFAMKDPTPVYLFVRKLCYDKCAALLEVAAARCSLPSEALAAAEEPPNGPPAGARFGRWRRQSTRTVDFVVVGAGVVGAACAAYLAAEGASVEILEQSVAANPNGSSNGDSRMYREMQSDAFYTRLQRAALPLWRDLEAASGAQLLSPNGLLFYGENTVETVEGSIPGAAATMRALGVPHTPMAAADMAARWPAIAAHSADAGLFEAGGGAIAATAAVRAFVRQALAAGAALREGVRVESCALVRQQHGRRCSELALSDGTMVRATRRVVFAAGAWTPELLQRTLGVTLRCEIHSVAWGHYEVDDAMPEDALPQWFAFRGKTHTRDPLLEGCHGLYYGFPAIAAPAGAATRRVAKVGVDYTPADAAHRPATMGAFRRQPAEAVAADMDAFVASHWPGLRGRTDLQCSPYSMTPNGDFVLGPVPGVPGAAVFCGGSGRAFKFAPLLGACLADVACGRPPRHDLEGRFDPVRLLVPDK